MQFPTSHPARSQKCQNSFDPLVTSTPSGYTCAQPSNMTGTIGSTDVLLTINCAAITYTLSASAGTGGSVSPPYASYSYGSGANVYAYESIAGYTFSYWSGDCAGQGSTCSLSSMTANKSATAYFNAPPTCSSNQLSPPLSIGSSRSVSCPANSGIVPGTVLWGDSVYTGDSWVCAAAVHLGVLSKTNAGTITVRCRPGLSSYTGTTRNGVTSSSYGSWPTSVTISAP